MVFAGLALFGDWSWWNVLYAAIVSGVAKWLTRGFLGNQKRIAFAADMVSKGMSPKEAGQAWLETYKGPRASPTPSNGPTDTPKITENRAKAKTPARTTENQQA